MTLQNLTFWGWCAMQPVHASFVVCVQLKKSLKFQFLAEIFQTPLFEPNSNYSSKFQPPSISSESFHSFKKCGNTDSNNFRYNSCLFHHSQPLYHTRGRKSGLRIMVPTLFNRITENAQPRMLSPALFKLRANFSVDNKI